MIILGIDPGIAIMGYGVIEYIGNRYRTITYNSILTPAHTPDAERLKSIYSQLRNIIYEYTCCNITYNCRQLKHEPRETFRRREQCFYCLEE